MNQTVLLQHVVDSHVCKPNLWTVAIRTFVIIALEPRRAQASLCMLFKIVHGLCFFHPTWLPQGQTTVSKQTVNYCSNNHLLAPMHIALICTTYYSCVELAPTKRCTKYSITAPVFLSYL